MKSSIGFLAVPLALMFVHSAAAAQTTCWVPPASLVSWWTGDTGERDLYGVNNPSAVNAVTLVQAKVAKGFTFGAGGYIDIPHSATLANQKFTWDAWVKPAGPGPNDDQYGSIILQQGIDNLEVSVSLNWRSNPDDRFVFEFGNVNSEAIYSKDTFPAGAFYFVAGTYDGTTFRLYVNGVLEGTFTETKTIPYSTDPWDIGSGSPLSRSEGFPRTFNGIIDEVEAFKGALSQSAIQAIYKRGSVGKCKAAVVLTPTSLNFGEQNVGTTSAPKIVTVINNRDASVTIDGFAFTGTDPTDFGKSSTTCASTLAARKSCTVDVTFTPSATGTRTAILEVKDTAVGSPQAVKLSGTGNSFCFNCYGQCDVDRSSGTLTGYCSAMVSLHCQSAHQPTQCAPGQVAKQPEQVQCGVIGQTYVDAATKCDPF